MKHTSIAARTILILMTLLLCLPISCTSNQNSAEMVQLVQSLITERDELENRLQVAERENEDLKAQLAETQKEHEHPLVDLIIGTETKEIVVTKEVPAKYVYGIHCTVNGEKSIQLSGQTEVKCVADKIEGYVFDHWELNGKEAKETGATASFTVIEGTVIEALYHQKHTVTCINCHLQFLNDQGNAKGKEYTEFDFENAYTNPVTNKKCEGGKISFYLTADIPNRMEVDYWLVNGVKYQYPGNVTKYRVEDLDEQTVYEVVFKGQSPKKTTVSPTPARYYNVKCINCTFTGGGASGKEGKVPEGTVITITGTSDSSACYFVGNPSSASRGSYGSPLSPNSSSPGKYVFTYTYKVTSDTTISFYGIIN